MIEKLSQEISRKWSWNRNLKKDKKSALEELLTKTQNATNKQTLGNIIEDIKEKFPSVLQGRNSRTQKLLNSLLDYEKEEQATFSHQGMGRKL